MLDLGDLAPAGHPFAQLDEAMGGVALVGSANVNRVRNNPFAGEGAGLMILEDYGAAQKRGATIHGELLGYSATTGVPHTDVPHCARILAECINRALRRAEREDLLRVIGDDEQMATPDSAVIAVSSRDKLDTRPHDPRSRL